MKTLVRYSVLACCAAIAGPIVVRAAAPVALPPVPGQMILASHKALYSVTLTGTRPGSDYIDVSGKMSLEFADKCNVWTTQQKSILLTIAGDGSEESSDSEFKASESKAGDVYTFHLRQNQDGEVTEYEGSATRSTPDGPGAAEYSLPKHSVYRLPPHFLFQVAQQIKLIEVAQKGGRFLGGEMFDGTEGGGAARFNAVMLNPETRATLTPTIRNPLLNSPSHRVRVAYYSPSGTSEPSAADDGTSSTDADQPEYEMTMTLHDNGVVSDYDYDYQDFSVHGKLEAIQALPRPHC
jgi:hypothetical protein